MSSAKEMNYSNLDRFIPNRSATMDMGYAQTMICDRGRKEKYPNMDSPYQILLASACLNPINRNRILYFKPNKPTPTAVQPLLPQAAKPRRRHFPKAPEFKLDAPDLVDNYFLNLLDWGRSNVLAIALGNQVYLRHAITRSTWQLTNFQEEDQVTSVNWAANDGHLIAVGLANSQVQLWDIIAGRNLRTLRGCHSSRVGSLAWNKNILTTGGMDGCIVNNDMRLNSHIVETYRGHEGEVCGLKWSASGKQLASGGNDNLLYIWDTSFASSQQWLHRCDDHTGAVRALAWSPFQRNLLASGGGDDDSCIKFWNTQTGACLNSVDTGSQVCGGLLWNKNGRERELLVSQGFPHNQLTLWNYPSMNKIAQLIEPGVPRTLYMAQSPDGCTVATAGDESLRLWNVFEAKPVPNKKSEPFAHFNRIR